MSYWIVIKCNRDGVPFKGGMKKTYSQHATQEIAVAESHRLAQCNPGYLYGVFQFHPPMAFMPVDSEKEKAVA